MPAQGAAPATATATRTGRFPFLAGAVVLGGIAAAATAVILLGRRPPEAPRPEIALPTPTEPTPTEPEPTQPAAPQPAPQQDISIGQLNAYNLFDTVDDPRKQDDVRTEAEYDLHLHRLALTLRDT
ncbi:MAG: hypothetical protein JWM25_679, partial [Thermoleophilia bacterium]|nr:hypothetical protein [Thermoleophilia bacterium]